MILSERAEQLVASLSKTWQPEYHRSNLISLAHLVVDIAKEIEVLRGPQYPRPAGADTPQYAGESR